MERPPRIFLLLYAIPLFFIGVTSLGRVAYSFHKDYHWTPGRRPLQERQGRFEIYVRGKLLDQALEDGQLTIREGTDCVPLKESDVTIRYNQIDRITRGPLLTGVGCLSAAVAWTLLGFVLWKKSAPGS